MRVVALFCLILALLAAGPPAGERHFAFDVPVTALDATAADVAATSPGNAGSMSATDPRDTIPQRPSYIGPGITTSSITIIKAHAASQSTVSDIARPGLGGTSLLPLSGSGRAAPVRSLPLRI